jgi:hypothetical protein
LRRACTRAKRSGPSTAWSPLLPHLLHPPPHLVLNSEIHRALHRRHELREILLLALGQVEPLSLDSHCLVEQLRHARLLGGIACSHLPAQLLSRLPLLTQQLHALAFVTGVHLPELLHLRVVQVETTPNHLSEPQLELPRERCLLSTLELTLLLLLLALQSLRPLGFSTPAQERGDERQRSEEIA